jgi:hypothetical protein
MSITYLLKKKQVRRYEDAINYVSDIPKKGGRRGDVNIFAKW